MRAFMVSLLVLLISGCNTYQEKKVVLRKPISVSAPGFILTDASVQGTIRANAAQYCPGYPYEAKNVTRPSPDAIAFLLECYEP